MLIVSINNHYSNLNFTLFFITLFSNWILIIHYSVLVECLINGGKYLINSPLCTIMTVKTENLYLYINYNMQHLYYSWCGYHTTIVVNIIVVKL